MANDQKAAAPTHERFAFGGAFLTRRSVSAPPQAETMCFVEDMSAGRRGKSGGAYWRDGEWFTLSGKPLGWHPTHWTVLEHADG